MTYRRRSRAKKIKQLLDSLNAAQCTSFFRRSEEVGGVSIKYVSEVYVHKYTQGTRRPGGTCVSNFKITSFIRLKSLASKKIIVIIIPKNFEPSADKD